MQCSIVVHCQSVRWRTGRRAFDVSQCTLTHRTQRHLRLRYPPVPSVACWIALQSQTTGTIRTTVSRFQRIPHEPFDIDACAGCSAGLERL